MKEKIKFKTENKVEKDKQEGVEGIRDRLREVISEAKVKFAGVVNDFGEREALKKVGSQTRHLYKIEADNIPEGELLFYKEIEDVEVMDDKTYESFVQKLNEMLNEITPDEAECIAEHSKEVFKEATSNSIRALFSSIIRDKHIEYMNSISQKEAA